MDITVIGGGNMGGALVKGWYKSNLDATITVVDKVADKQAALKESCPDIILTDDGAGAVAKSDVVVIVVKPWQVKEVIDSVGDSFREDTILISIAAGVKLEQLDEMLDGYEKPRMFYVIPNIAAEFGQSMSFISPAPGVEDGTIAKVKELFQFVGGALICDEKTTHAGMLMASCGLAYIMRILRAQTQAGIEMGFYAKDALNIAMQTMEGAVALLQGTGEHPEQAIDRVSTPGGYTIKGLNEMDHSGLSSAIINTFKTGF
ncbi:MAG: pyrroline-5-carboxylate reductase [Bacteroidaceae bacterium]|nr:pyrroline-5-carboxylate reductase [Bacteroidaceae bacterium]